MARPLLSGQCRYCHCAGEACTLVDGDRCGWYDKARTCCTAPGCIRQYENDRRAQPKPRRRTPGEVHALILEERRAKRRRYREAAERRGLLRGGE